jgi:DNA-binding transcriptional regulator GbsR (MarR family)
MALENKIIKLTHTTDIIYKTLAEKSSPMSTDELSNLLGVPKRNVALAIKKLLKINKVISVKKNLFTVSNQGEQFRHSVRETTYEITGRLSVSREGYGFIEAGEGKDDIFIPQRSPVRRLTAI